MTNIMYASTSPTTSTSRPIQPFRMVLKTSSSCSLFPKSSSQGHGLLWKGFFAHHENILIGMLRDENKEVRRQAVLNIRQRNKLNLKIHKT